MEVDYESTRLGLGTNLFSAAATNLEMRVAGECGYVCDYIPLRQFVLFMYEWIVGYHGRYCDKMPMTNNVIGRGVQTLYNKCSQNPYLPNTRSVVFHTTLAFCQWHSDQIPSSLACINMYMYIRYISGRHRSSRFYEQVLSTYYWP